MESQQQRGIPLACASMANTSSFVLAGFATWTQISLDAGSAGLRGPPGQRGCCWLQPAARRSRLTTVTSKAHNSRAKQYNQRLARKQPLAAAEHRALRAPLVLREPAVEARRAPQPQAQQAHAQRAAALAARRQQQVQAAAAQQARAARQVRLAAQAQQAQQEPRQQARAAPRAQLAPAAQTEQQAPRAPQQAEAAHPLLPAAAAAQQPAHQAPQAQPAEAHSNVRASATATRSSSSAIRTATTRSHIVRWLRSCKRLRSKMGPLCEGIPIETWQSQEQPLLHLPQISRTSGRMPRR